MANRVNVELLMRSLSEIMSDKYGVEVTYTATLKEEAKSRSENKSTNTDINPAS